MARWGMLNLVRPRQGWQVVPMRAAPGDRLIIDARSGRVGEVIGVPHADGSPPYVIKWRRGGHIALVSPDSYAVLIPAECTNDARADPAR